jgi:hypothetical protein
MRQFRRFEPQDQLAPIGCSKACREGFGCDDGSADGRTGRLDSYKESLLFRSDLPHHLQDLLNNNIIFEDAQMIHIRYHEVLCSGNPRHSLSAMKIRASSENPDASRQLTFGCRQAATRLAIQPMTRIDSAK